MISAQLIDDITSALAAAPEMPEGWLVSKLAGIFADHQAPVLASYRKLFEATDRLCELIRKQHVHAVNQRALTERILMDQRAKHAALLNVKQAEQANLF